MPSIAVEVEGIYKTFGANQVLSGVDVTLPAGQVTVLMGANGAGKSTLVKILSGVYRADSGSIKLHGAALAPTTPAAAIAAGVVTVHQNINDGVIPDLDVASNLMLDKLAEPGGGFFFNKRATRAAARDVAAAIGLEVEVTRNVGDLSLADRQQVAIARAMTHQPKLLILDEPTSSLSATEANRLFDMIDRLREAGVCILYITHRMSDVRRMADRIISMRDGKIAGTFETQPLDYEAAVQAMLGHRLTDVGIAVAAGGAGLLALNDIRLRDGATPFSMTLNANEVVAITGLVGSGKSDLANMMFGVRPPVAGEMMLNGVAYRPRTPRQAIEAGVFLCAKDRANNAMVPDFDLSGNVTLPFLVNYSTGSFLSGAKQRQRAREMIDDLDIVCQSERDDIGSLSGGNQQKVMVARWLAEQSLVLILDEPFQGVDIRARQGIGRTIRETAEGRATVVLVAELDEALEIADQIVVMSEHTIVGRHRNEAIDINQVLAQVAGRSGGQSAVQQ